MIRQALIIVLLAASLSTLHANELLVPTATFISSWTSTALTHCYHHLVALGVGEYLTRTFYATLAGIIVGSYALWKLYLACLRACTVLYPHCNDGLWAVHHWLTHPRAVSEVVSYFIVGVLLSRALVLLSIFDSDSYALRAFNSLLGLYGTLQVLLRFTRVRQRVLHAVLVYADCWVALYCLARNYWRDELAFLADYRAHLVLPEGRDDLTGYLPAGTLAWMYRAATNCWLSASQAAFRQRVTLALYEQLSPVISVSLGTAIPAAFDARFDLGDVFYSASAHLLGALARAGLFVFGNDSLAAITAAIVRGVKFRLGLVCFGALLVYVLLPSFLFGFLIAYPFGYVCLVLGCLVTLGFGGNYLFDHYLIELVDRTNPKLVALRTVLETLRVACDEVLASLEQKRAILDDRHGMVREHNLARNDLLFVAHTTKLIGAITGIVFLMLGDHASHFLTAMISNMGFAAFTSAATLANLPITTQAKVAFASATGAQQFVTLPDPISDHQLVSLDEFKARCASSNVQRKYGPRMCAYSAMFAMLANRGELANSYFALDTDSSITEPSQLSNEEPLIVVKCHSIMGTTNGAYYHAIADFRNVGVLSVCDQYIYLVQRDGRFEYDHDSLKRYEVDGATLAAYRQEPIVEIPSDVLEIASEADTATPPIDPASMPELVDVAPTPIPTSKPSFKDSFLAQYANLHGKANFEWQGLKQLWNQADVSLGSNADEVRVQNERRAEQEAKRSPSRAIIICVALAGVVGILYGLRKLRSRSAELVLEGTGGPTLPVPAGSSKPTGRPPGRPAPRLLPGSVNTSLIRAGLAKRVDEGLRRVFHDALLSGRMSQEKYDKLPTQFRVAAEAGTRDKKSANKKLRGLLNTLYTKDNIGDVAEFLTRSGYAEDFLERQRKGAQYFDDIRSNIADALIADYSLTPQEIQRHVDYSEDLMVMALEDNLDHLYDYVLTTSMKNRRRESHKPASVVKARKPKGKGGKAKESVRAESSSFNSSVDSILPRLRNSFVSLWKGDDFICSGLIVNGGRFILSPRHIFRSKDDRIVAKQTIGGAEQVRGLGYKAGGLPSDATYDTDQVLSQLDKPFETRAGGFLKLTDFWVVNHEIGSMAAFFITPNADGTGLNSTAVTTQVVTVKHKGSSYFAVVHDATTENGHCGSVLVASNLRTKQPVIFGLHTFGGDLRSGSSASPTWNTALPIDPCLIGMCVNTSSLSDVPKAFNPSVNAESQCRFRGQVVKSGDFVTPAVQYLTNIGPQIYERTTFTALGSYQSQDYPGAVFEPANLDIGNLDTVIAKTDDDPGSRSHFDSATVIYIRAVLELLFQQVGFEVTPLAVHEFQEVLQDRQRFLGAPGFGFSHYDSKYTLINDLGSEQLYYLLAHDIWTHTPWISNFRFKDEQRSVGKLPRAFVSCSVQEYFAGLLLFEKYNDLLTGNRSWKSVIGIDPFREFHTIYSELQAERDYLRLPDKFACADIAASDKRQKHHVRKIFIDMLRLPPAWRALFEKFVAALDQRLVVDQRGRLWIFFDGFGSGGFCTLHFNTIYTLICLLAVLASRDVTVVDAFAWPMRYGGDDLVICWPFEDESFYDAWRRVIIPVTGQEATNENGVEGDANPPDTVPLAQAQIYSFGFAFDDVGIAHPRTLRPNKVRARLYHIKLNDNVRALLVQLHQIHYYHDGLRGELEERLKNDGVSPQELQLLCARAMRLHNALTPETLSEEEVYKVSDHSAFFPPFTSMSAPQSANSSGSVAPPRPKPKAKPKQIRQAPKAPKRVQAPRKEVTHLPQDEFFKACMNPESFARVHFPGPSAESVAHAKQKITLQIPLTAPEAKDTNETVIMLNQEPHNMLWIRSKAAIEYPDYGMLKVKPALAKKRANFYKSGGHQTLLLTHMGENKLYASTLAEHHVRMRTQHVWKTRDGVTHEGPRKIAATVGARALLVIGTQGFFTTDAFNAPVGDAANSFWNNSGSRTYGDWTTGVARYIMAADPKSNIKQTLLNEFGAPVMGGALNAASLGGVPAGAMWFRATTGTVTISMKFLGPINAAVVPVRLVNIETGALVAFTTTYVGDTQVLTAAIAGADYAVQLSSTLVIPAIQQVAVTFPAIDSANDDWFQIAAPDADTITSSFTGTRLVCGSMLATFTGADLVNQGLVCGGTYPKGNFSAPEDFDEVSYAQLAAIPGSATGRLEHGRFIWQRPFGPAQQLFIGDDMPVGGSPDYDNEAYPRCTIITAGAGDTASLQLTAVCHYEGPSNSQLFGNRTYPGDPAAMAFADAALANIPNVSENPIHLLIFSAAVVAWRTAVTTYHVIEAVVKFGSAFKEAYQRTFDAKSDKKKG